MRLAPAKSSVSSELMARWQPPADIALRDRLDDPNCTTLASLTTHIRSEPTHASPSRPRRCSREHSRASGTPRRRKAAPCHPGSLPSEVVGLPSPSGACLHAYKARPRKRTLHMGGRAEAPRASAAAADRPDRREMITRSKVYRSIVQSSTPGVPGCLQRSYRRHSLNSKQHVN